MSTQPNFNNTEIAFASKSNQELQAMKRLFSLFNVSWLVSISSKIGLQLAAWNIPMGWAIKDTIFKQFCGGETLEETQKVVKKLAEYGISSIMDYGVEAKDEESEFDNSVLEFLKTIDYVSTLKYQKIFTLKVTGLAKFSLLEKLHTNESLSDKESQEWLRVLERMNKICEYASKKNVSLYIDAEESWIQNPIDQLALVMMKNYNKEKCIVYNTYQMYRHETLAFLIENIETAKEHRYLLGAKIVRGAYMEKERKRAAEKNYESPIQKNKTATDKAYNDALNICLENLENVSFVCATHNEESTKLTLEILEKKQINNNHHHVHFSQLYGMSDHLTFGLASIKCNVSKYLPFGPIQDVIPYLIRRAQENSSMSGQMSRELKMINEEIGRRKDKKK